MAAKKRSPETPPETPMRVPAHGRGALRVGGTNKGGPGRPPNAFRDFLAAIRSNPKALQALQDAASDPACRNFGNAWKLIGEYDEDKPAEKKQIVGPIEVRVKIAREGRRTTAS